MAKITKKRCAADKVDADGVSSLDACPASCGSRDIEVAGRAGSAARAASSEPTAATLSLALQNGPHTRAAAQLRAEAR